jgi:hypothetical protein
MFTFEIRINGSLVGHVYGENKGLEPCGKLTKYFYTYFKPESGRVIKGHVRHERNGGIEPLLSLILADVQKIDLP